MRLRKSTCPAPSAPCTWNTCFAMSKPIVVACFTDASFGGSLTPSPWHADAVGGRPPHHPLQPVAAPTANGSIGARGGWRGDEPERRVSYREPDLCCGVRGKVLEPSANGGSQIADRTLLARSAPAAVRRKRPINQSQSSMRIFPLQRHEISYVAGSPT